MGPIKEKIIEVVNRIPEGHVTWYGAVATIVQAETESRVTAQLVGWQLSGMQEREWSALPWWRVIAKSGLVSTLKLGDKGWRQIELLEKEDIEVKNHTVDMTLYAVGPEQLKVNN